MAQLLLCFIDRNDSPSARGATYLKLNYNQQTMLEVERKNIKAHLYQLAFPSRRYNDD